MVNEQKIEHIKKGKPFSVFDIIVISLALLLSVSFIIYMTVSREEGSSVRIRDMQTGTSLHYSLKDTYSLEKGNALKIPCEDGELVVLIENGSVRVHSAPCPKKECMHKGAIRYAGQYIICVPEKIIIEIGGESWYQAALG